MFDAFYSSSPMSNFFGRIANCVVCAQRQIAEVSMDFMFLQSLTRIRSSRRWKTVISVFLVLLLLVIVGVAISFWRR